MLKSSVTARVVLFFWNQLMQSRFFAVLFLITEYFAFAYRESSLRKIILGVGNLENHTEDSLFYKGLGKLLGFFVNAAKKIAEVFGAWSGTSALCGLYKKVSVGSFLLNTDNFFALCIMCIFLVPHAFWNNMFAPAIVLLLGVIYVFCLAKNKGCGQNAKAIPFQLVLFFFSLLVATAISKTMSDSIRILIFFMTSLGFCVLVFGFIRDKASLERFARIIYFTIIIAALFGLVQGVLGVKADASFTDLELNKDMPGRVFGPLDNPNNYAEYLMIFLPFAFAYAITRKSADSKLFHLIGLVFPFAALLTTYSRSSWIALAAACVLYVVIYSYKLVPVFAAGVICALPFVPQSIYNRILTIGNVSDSSSAYRITIWTGVLDMMKERWFTGVGLGPEAFTRVFQNYALGDTVVARHSHMQLLEMLVEGGVLCFVAYIWLFAWLIKKSSAAAVKAKDDISKHYLCAAAASVTAIAVIGMFEYCWFYPRIMFAFFISVGLCLASVKVNNRENRE